MNGYIFLCSNSTEEEYFDKKLFGGGLKYKSQITQIEKGDYLFLYNYIKNKLYGIFKATSEAEMNIDPTAWGGKFPRQVKVEQVENPKPLYRIEFEECLHFGRESKHPAAKLTEKELNRLIEKFRSPQRILEGDITFISSFPAYFKTVDGHVVRSKGELQIDNWLYENRIIHS